MEYSKFCPVPEPLRTALPHAILKQLPVYNSLLLEYLTSTPVAGQQLKESGQVYYIESLNLPCKLKPLKFAVEEPNCFEIYATPAVTLKECQWIVFTERWYLFRTVVGAWFLRKNALPVRGSPASRALLSLRWLVVTRTSLSCEDRTIVHRRITRQWQNIVYWETLHEM